MDTADLQEQIARLEKQIALLPKGTITKKKVNDKEYFYHRRSEAGKRQEKYVPAEDAPALQDQIKQRRSL